MKDEFSQGDALPSIRILAKDLHISVIKTKRAYDELEREDFNQQSVLFKSITDLTSLNSPFNSEII